MILLKQTYYLCLHIKYYFNSITIIYDLFKQQCHKLSQASASY